MTINFSLWRFRFLLVLLCRHHHHSAFTYAQASIGWNGHAVGFVWRLRFLSPPFYRANEILWFKT